MEQKSVDNALLLPTMYLRQAGLTRNPTFSYLYCVRCRGQGAASKAPLERKYSRYQQGLNDLTIKHDLRLFRRQGGQIGNS